MAGLSKKMPLQFAKLFMSDRYGQILIRHVPNDDAHCVEISYLDEVNGFVFFNFSFQKDPSGAADASSFFSAIDSRRAQEIIQGDLLGLDCCFSTVPIVFH